MKQDGQNRLRSPMPKGEKRDSQNRLRSPMPKGEL